MTELKLMACHLMYEHKWLDLFICMKKQFIELYDGGEKTEFVMPLIVFSCCAGGILLGQARQAVLAQWTTKDWILLSLLFALTVSVNGTEWYGCTSHKTCQYLKYLWNPSVTVETYFYKAYERVKIVWYSCILCQNSVHSFSSLDHTVSTNTVKKHTFYL